MEWLIESRNIYFNLTKVSALDIYVGVYFINGKLVGKVLDDENSYWIFSDITDNSFVWRNVMISVDGTSTLDCEILGKHVN